MEKFDFPHSLKNIPIPPRENYLKQLICKTENFIGRLRWAAEFFLRPPKQIRVKETYGFNSPLTPPKVKEIQPFEDELFELISSLKFSHFRSSFQKQLMADVQKIKTSDKVFLLADKTTNIYQVSVDLYKKLILNNVTKDYIQIPEEKVDKINREAALLASELELADRIEKHSEAYAYVTIKDHKPNFKTDPKCRLINPAKSQIGKISKQILQRICKEVRKETGINQWQSTEEVLEWFRKIPNKGRKDFLQFDIVEFYPSISEELLDKALDFASEITQITELDKKIIKHSRKAFLFFRASENSTTDVWQKKSGNFDVTMGAPDGAEICELCYAYILTRLNHDFPKLNLGLYRDDGLGAHPRIPGRELEKTKQKLHKVFKEFGLRITVEPSAKEVNFLDVTLDLTTETYKPYRKPNDQPLYVNVKSNHPPNVIKQVPLGINKRLNSISSREADFNIAKHEYQKALNDSGHKHELTFSQEPQMKKDKKNNKGRKIYWYNPPFNASVSTNIGKKFLALVDKHFKKSPLHKIFNRNTIKLSYSCTSNIKATIQAHNKKLLSKATEKPAANVKKCNCQKSKKDKCPLQGHCVRKDVIYEATTAETPPHKYIGSTENFKARYSGHKSSFKDPNMKHNTALSKHIWDNNLGTEPSLKWRIVAEAPSYQLGQRACQLCCTEKLIIMKNFSNPQFLNQRSELAQKCRHRARMRLDKCL